MDNVLPKSERLEQAIIASVLLLPDVYSEIKTKALQPKHFDTPEYAVIWQAMQALAAASTPIDTMTLSVQLEQMQAADADTMQAMLAAGGNMDLIEFDPRNSPNYAQQVIGLWAKRSGILDIGNTALQLGTDPSVAPIDMLNEIIRQAEAIRFELSRGDVTAEHLAGVMWRMVENTKARMETKQELIGTLTGLRALDIALNGLLKRRLHLLVSRTNMGKTLTLTEIVQLLAPQGYKILMFSTESTNDEIAQRMGAQIANVSGSDILTGNLSDQDFGKLADIVAAEIVHPDKNVQVWIDEYSLDFTKMESTIEIISRACGGLDLVIVDTADSMESTELKKALGLRSKYEVDSYSAERLKKWTKKPSKYWDFGVLVAKQLNRETAKRAGSRVADDNGIKDTGRPVVTDIQNSDIWAQQADWITAIHRPHYYDHNADPYLVELIILKRRMPQIQELKIWRLGYDATIPKLVAYDSLAGVMAGDI